MSTPRRSSRLRAAEEGKLQRQSVLRAKRISGRRANSHHRSHVLSSEEGSSSDSESVVVATPIRTPTRKKVNNYIRVHHSYNRDYSIDCYEPDFIDDSDMQTPEKKLPTSRAARSGIVSSSDSETECSHIRRSVKRKLTSSSSEDEEPQRYSNEEPMSHSTPANRDSEEDDVVISARKRRRATTELDSEDESDVPGQKRKWLKLESDDEVVSSRSRSSRAQKLRHNKEKKQEGSLRKLRAQRAKQKGFTPEISEGSDVGSPVREEREAGGVDLMKQVLFPDSDGSEEESDWIVSDFEDFQLPSPSQRLSLEEGHSEQERSWKDTLSVKGIFGLISEVIDIDQWLDSERAVIRANERDEDGMLPLAYVAGCAHPATFHTLLPHTDLEMLQSILTAKGTSLLPIIIEAPLTRGKTTNEDRGIDVVDPAALKDAASLECLEALWNHNRSHFKSLLHESSRLHPTLLEQTVWYSKPKLAMGCKRSWGKPGNEVHTSICFQCLKFLIQTAGATPHNGGLRKERDMSDVFESCFSHPFLPSPPPSLLHLAVMCEDGERTVEVLEQLLPALEEELELTDVDGYTALMHACDAGYSGALTALINHGAKINCKDRSGTSPLHLAALSGHTACVETLISHGHPVDCRDAKGWPPLLYAHFASHQDCVLTLMRAKPQQLSVLSELLRKTPDDGTDGRMKTIKVVRSLLVSLAHHETYYSLFNQFVSNNPSVLEDECFGFMKHCMRLLSFENKQAWLRSKLERLHEHGLSLAATTSLEPLVLWEIPRHNLLDTVYRLLSDATAAQCWLEPLEVKFRGEAGICSGPRKEFWSCLSRALVTGEDHLFASCDDGQLSLHPCTVFFKYCDALTTSVLERHMRLLHLVGMLMASAVFHGDTLDVHLTKPLIKQLLGTSLSHPDDLGDMDREFHHNICRWLDSDDFCDLELTFTCTLVSPWDSQSIEAPLMEGGRSRVVNEGNKEDYIIQLSKFKLENSISRELEAFQTGFWKVIPQRCLQVFTPNELSLLLSGVPKIDVNDWERNTEYRRFSASDQIIEWFWKLVRSLKEEEKALLLKFCTGSPRVPAGGFANLQGLGGPTRFTISTMPGENKIPQAATCFNNLRLAAYSCEQDLRDKTLIAIRYGCEGFEFS